MNVNVKVSITDDQRNKMFCAITGKDSTTRLVSRADVNKFVQEKIAEVINGRIVLPAAKSSDKFTDEQISDAVKSASDFSPSRGDEGYIFKAKDETLRAIHSRMLDCIEEYDVAVHELMEKNRI